MSDLIPNLVYGTKEPQRRRSSDKPMEVLALAPSRSATESMRKALLILGYDHTYHGWDIACDDSKTWIRFLRRKYFGAKNPHGGPHTSSSITADEFDKVLGHCRAVTDFPCAALAPELINAYPQAKVILNKRQDVHAWHRSILSAIAPLRGAWGYWFFCLFNGDFFWARRVMRTVWHDGWYNDRGDGKGMLNNAVWCYENHCAMVRGMCVGQREYLEFSVEEGWEPLCKFLGKEVPDISFPRGNDKDAFDKTVDDVLAKGMKKVLRNMGLWAAAMIGVAAIVGWRVFSRRGSSP